MVISTRSEFNGYLAQFKLARGLYNLSAFMELLGMELDGNYKSLKSFNGQYIIGSRDLSQFLRKAVEKKKLTPLAINYFCVGTNRKYKYSMVDTIESILLTLIADIKNSKYLKNFLIYGIPLRNVVVPRRYLNNRPLDEKKTLVKQYIYVWDLYATIVCGKEKNRLSYDVFKDRLKNLVTDTDDFIEFQKIGEATSLEPGMINESKCFLIEPTGYTIHELMSLGFLNRLYHTKIYENKVSVTQKRQYYKKGNAK